jgi:anti-sigma-K factor RskA
VNDRRIEISDYLLGELSPEDRAEAERRIREDREYRAEVERLRPVVESLEELPREAWEAPQPPPLRAPGPRPLAPPERRPDRRSAPWRRRFSLSPAVAATAAVLLVGAGTGVGVLVAGDGSGEPNGRGETVSLRPLGSAAGGASGTAQLADAGGGEAVVRVSGLPRSRDSDYYELWLLNAPDDLISLGSFRVPGSGDAEVRVPLPADPRRFRFLDISLEPVDGGAGHSGRSVLRART